MADDNSIHFDQRLRQRGFKQVHLRLLVAYGEAVLARGGAWALRLNKRDAKKIMEAPPEGVTRQDIEAAARKQIIVTDGLKGITAYNRLRGRSGGRYAPPPTLTAWVGA